MKSTLALALASTILAASLPAQAMDFKRHHVTDSSSDTIDMTGDIRHGDAQRFRAFLNSLGDTRNLVGIRLNSEGGYIAESLDLADAVAATHLPTMVPNNAICASACFLLFVVGSSRSVSSTAQVGVHGAAGSDKSDSVTIAMAKLLKDLGNVPDSVIVKMVTTPHDDIAWLDRADYAAMNVKVVEPQVAGAAPIPTPSPAPSAALPPYLRGIIQPDRQTDHVNNDTGNPFDEGRRDRYALQQWSDSLTGDYKAGAEFWASVRSTAEAAKGCNYPGQSGYWINGCLAAKAKLAPFDIRRRSEPDYRAGWNEASSKLE